MFHQDFTKTIFVPLLKWQKFRFHTQKNISSRSYLPYQNNRNLDSTSRSSMSSKATRRLTDSHAQSLELVSDTNSTSHASYMFIIFSGYDYNSKSVLIPCCLGVLSSTTELGQRNTTENAGPQRSLIHLIPALTRLVFSPKQPKPALGWLKLPAQLRTDPQTTQKASSSFLTGRRLES